MSAAMHGVDVDVEVQRRQRQLLIRAQQRSRLTHTREGRPSRWSHVPVEDFCAEHNRLYTRSDGRIESGHEPVHNSRTGRCVLIDTASGWWWCRSCGQSGDAASWVMTTRGLSYAAAASTLAERYGPPTGPKTRRRRGIRGAPVWRTL